MKLINVMLVSTVISQFQKHQEPDYLSVTEAETFIKEKKLGPLEGFRSKRGFLFAGTIVLTDDYKLIFDFESAEDDSLIELNYEKKDIIGNCPKCSGDVVIHKTSYICAQFCRKK